jgi:biotin carboxylase
VVAGADDLRHAVGEDEYIAQEVARGQEYTIDVFVDATGRCRCAVPRLRIETRGGEVTKSVTVRSQRLQEIGCRVAEALPGAHGVLNIQVFYEEASGALTVSEINPRFGGGYPLTHQAGAPMARWVLEELIGREPTVQDDAWTDGRVMLRYDEAVFVDAARAGIGASPAHRAADHATVDRTAVDRASADGASGHAAVDRATIDRTAVDRSR